MRRALPDAEAVSLQSGWPTPISDVVYRNRTVGDVLVFGVTPPYQIVQDYRFAAGEPLTEPDVRERRLVVVLGLRRGGQAVRRARTRRSGEKVRVAGQRDDGEGRHRQEGAGARPVVRRLRC